MLQNNQNSGINSDLFSISSTKFDQLSMKPFPAIVYFCRTFVQSFQTAENCLKITDDRSHQYFILTRTNNMTTDERIRQSETRIFKAVFPSTTNHYDTLFGGTAMQLMDEVAFIAATRFSRQRMVTVSSDRIDFKKPIPAGTIVELIGKVSYLGSSSLKVHVDIFIEQMYAEGREKAVSGDFTFVAIDENKTPVKIIKD